MDWLKSLTYLFIVLWLLGIYAEHSGDRRGADVLSIFGPLTFLRLVANLDR